jgi:putative flippase GtrA
MLTRLPPFFRFAIVGTLGLVVDLTILWTALHVLGTGPYAGRAISFAFAVTFTWALNRHLTFGDKRARDAGGMAREWAKFVAANSIGLAVNYAVYAALIRWADGLFADPLVAAGLGAIAGLAFNYTASSRLVFKALP